MKNIGKATGRAIMHCKLFEFNGACFRSMRCAFKNQSVAYRKADKDISEPLHGVEIVLEKLKGVVSFTQ